MDQKKPCIIIHYDEIGLKGRNRSFFESKLIENLRKSLNRYGVLFQSIEKVPGRIVINIKPKTKKNLARKAVKNVFGVANFSFAYKLDRDIKKLKKYAVDLLRKQRFNSFAIETQRSDKDFRLNSQEINEKIGASVQKELNKEVDLETPDKKVFCEITHNHAYLYNQKIESRGGLPVSTAGKGFVMLSGGIDSPVAAYMASKRGIKPIYIHFHSYPYTSKKAIEKNRKIVKKLTDYTFNTKLILVPFADIQESIVKATKPKYRIIFYRKLMFKIAERIAPRFDSKALITGESIGQVSSQTIENINAISNNIDLAVLRPLIGMDKLEITEKAKEIGTYKISTQKADDTCTRFMPDQPATKPSMKEIEDEAQKIEIENLIEMGLSNIEEESIGG
ncbi:MAG: tRNA uracil 4-sulfurtransferase ThiI [Candidatus Magasanikbacteria bacterium]